MCIDITIDIESFYTELRIGVVFNSIVSILLVLLPFLAILLVSRVSHFELVGFWVCRISHSLSEQPVVLYDISFNEISWNVWEIILD